MNTLKQYRTRLALTQRQAAAILGVSVRTWESWESGKRNMPDIKRQMFELLTGGKS